MAWQRVVEGTMEAQDGVDVGSNPDCGFKENFLKKKTPKSDPTSWCFQLSWVSHNILACTGFPKIIHAFSFISCCEASKSRESKPHQLSGNRYFPISQTRILRSTGLMRLVKDRTRTWTKPYGIVPGPLLSKLPPVRREKKDISWERLCARLHGSHFSPISSFTTLEGK